MNTSLKKVSDWKSPKKPFNTNILRQQSYGTYRTYLFIKICNSNIIDILTSAQQLLLKLSQKLLRNEIISFFHWLTGEYIQKQADSFLYLYSRTYSKMTLLMVLKWQCTEWVHDVSRMHCRHCLTTVTWQKLIKDGHVLELNSWSAWRISLDGWLC